MSTAVVSTGFSQEAFDAFLAARDEPKWLDDMRRAAWQDISQERGNLTPPSVLQQCLTQRRHLVVTNAVTLSEQQDQCV